MIPVRVEVHVSEVVVRGSPANVDRELLASALTRSIAEAVSNAEIDVDPAMLGTALADRVGKELKP